MIVGIVVDVNFKSGRKDGLINLTLEKDDTTPYSHMLYCNLPDSILKWNGMTINYPVLMSYLASCKARVKLYPESDLYQASRKADFEEILERTQEK